MTRKSHLYIHWTLLLLFLLFKIIGLATFSVESNSSKRKFSFTGTKMGILYNLLLLCLMAASNFATIPNRYYVQYANKSMITTIIEVFQGILGTLMICTVLVCYCTNQSALVRIGNHLIRVKAELRQLREPINLKRTVYPLLVVYLFQLGLFVVVLATDYLAFRTNPLMWLTDIVPTTFAGWLFIQYFSVLTLVNATFADVNDSIQSLCRNCSHCNRPVSLYRSRRVVVSTSTIQPLLQLRNIHDNLCNISGDISEFYSWPILIGVSFVFFTLVYNAYYLLIPIVVESKVLDSMLLANTILWLVFLVYPVGLLTTKITNTVKEIGKTRISVHTLLNCAIDRETKAELLHRKIKFTASGYFALDNTLFQTMLGAGATYLVILIQFQMAISFPTICHCNCTR